MKIGRKICDLRKDYGLTQLELGEKIGVSEQAISKWENDKSLPDVSLLPILATLFNCSVDYILGIEDDTYGKSIEDILLKYKQCKSADEEIELLQKALIKYPSSNDLKLKLAHSYFMMYRISETRLEQQSYFNKTINLCENVVSHSKEDFETDKAFDLLTQIYSENGEYEKAKECCERLTAKSWKQKILGIAQILRESKDDKKLSFYSQNNLLDLQTTMKLLCNLYCNNLLETNNNEEALKVCELQERILAIFDIQHSELYLIEKMTLAFQMATVYKKIGNEEFVYQYLCKMIDYAKKAIHKGKEHKFSENPFLEKVDIYESYMTKNEIQRFVNSFLDKFMDFLNEDTINKLKI